MGIISLTTVRLGGLAVNSTRQRILEVSLELFSQRGFSGVSIREVCRQVQIKESSLYYHFQNKRAILDTLLVEFEAVSSRTLGRLYAAIAEQGAAIQVSFYRMACDAFFEEYLMDPFCNRVMRLLAIERFCNATIGELHNRWLLVEPILFQREVFSALMEAGAIPRHNCDYLAVRYCAPIYLFAQRWLFSGTLTEEQKNAFRTHAYRHVQMFFTEIRRK